MNSVKFPVKLANNSKEREEWDNLAELYSLILTVEKLEKAYVKDSISKEDYVRICDELIAKFKTFRGIVNMTDIKQFMAQYKMNCPAAYNRLVVMGVNATVEHGSGDKFASGVLVLETTQNFITAMDNIRLNMRSVDDVQPNIKVLLESLNSNNTMEFPGKAKLKQWLPKLNEMKAHEEISETDARQLLLDLENAYNEYSSELSKHSR